MSIKEGVIKNEAGNSFCSVVSSFIIPLGYGLWYYDNHPADSFIALSFHYERLEPRRSQEVNTTM